MKSIRESWESFERDCMPPDAPQIQRQEMRRAFYAGAFSTVCSVRDIGDDSVSEEQGVDFLAALVAEAKEFSRRVQEGEA